MPNINSETIDLMLSVEERYPQNCFSMMGLHPCSVNRSFERELYIIEEWLNKRIFSAIGEIGIDRYRSNDHLDLERQEETFRIQVEWAKKLRIPIVIHARSASLKVIDLLEDLNDDRLKGIWHCFTGSAAEAQKIILFGGFKLGIGGIITFKNNHQLEEMVSNIDIHHLVLETDSPYLTPVPHRGKKNQPAYLPFIAQKMARIKRTDLQKIEEITDINAKEIFCLPLS